MTQTIPRDPAQVSAVSCVVVRGTTVLGAFVPPTGAGAIQASGTTTGGSVAFSRSDRTDKYDKS